MTNPQNTAAPSFGASPVVGVVDSYGIARTAAVEEDDASDAVAQVQQQEEEREDEEQANFKSPILQVVKDISGSSEASMPIPTMPNHEIHESGIATEPLAVSTAATGTDSSAVRDNNVDSGPNVDLATSQQVSSEPKEFKQGLKCMPEDRTTPTSDWTPPLRDTTRTSDPHGFRSTMSASRARKRAIELQVSQSATTRLAHSHPTVDSSNRTLPRDDDRSSCTMGSSVSSYLSAASLQRQVRNLNNLLNTPLDSHLGDLAVDPESGRWDESTRSIVSEWNNLARAESMMRLELENAEAQMEMDMTDSFEPPVGALGQSFRRRDDSRFSLLGIQPIKEESSELEDAAIHPSQSGPKSSEVKDAFAACGGQEDANRCTATEPQVTTPRPRLGELPETLPPLEDLQTTAPKPRAVAAAPRDGLHCRGSSRFSLMTGGSISSFSGSSLQLSDAIRQQFHDMDHLLTSTLDSHLGDLASRSEIERNQSTRSIVSEWNNLARAESMMRLELEKAQAQMEMDMKDSSAPPVGALGQSFRRRDDTRFSLLGIQPIEEEISGLEDVTIHPTQSGPKSSEVKAAFMSGRGQEEDNLCAATEPQMTPSPSPAEVTETPPLSVTSPPDPDGGLIAELPKLTPEDMTKPLYLKLLMGALLIGVLTLVVGISVGVRDGMGPKENLEMNGTLSPPMALEEVNCNPNISSFESQVFSNVEIDPSNASNYQILEQVFMHTYNNLALRTCDGLFRSITEVKLMFHHANRNSSHQDSRRLQQDANTTVSHHHNSSSDLLNGTSIGPSNNIFLDVNATDEGRREFAATFFSVKGECRGCEVPSSGTFNLFDDAFDGGRRLQTGEAFLSPSKINIDFSVDPSTCVCLAGMAPSAIGNGPTLEAFGEALANEIALLDQHSGSELLESPVGNFREGMQVSCSGDVQDFTTYVYADFTMEDGQLTDVIKHRMENVFLETYNDLSFQACDEFFRVVSRVGLVLSDEVEGKTGVGRRLTDGENATHSYNATRAPLASAAYFEVTGRCRNCPVSTTGQFSLFDDAFRRRRSLTKESSVDHSPVLGSGRKLQEALDVCLCPQGKSSGEEPPPSTQEFLDDFNSNMAKSHEQEAKAKQEEQKEEEGGTSASDSFGFSDDTVFVQPSVGKIREGMQVTCSGEIQDFTTYVYADFTMEDVQVTEEVRKRMENIFLETYNDFTFHACDGFFRVITDVGLVIPDQFDGSAGDRRQLKVGDNSTYNYNATRDPTATQAYFKVTGRCRNCPVSTSGSFALFDEAFRRQRSLQGKTLSPPSHSSLSLRRRRMQEALDLCLCPQGKEPGNEPPPSPEEFQAEFNDNIIKAQEEKEKAKLLEEAEEDRVQEESAGTATQASVVPVLLIQKLVSPELPSVSNTTSSPRPPPTTAEPTPPATDKGTHQPTQKPTFEPTVRPIPKPNPLPTSNATSAPNGTAPGPSKPTPLAMVNVSLSPNPQPLPNLTSNITSMSYPGHVVTSCNETLQEMDEFVDLTISGSNATQVENSFLIDAFMNASDQMQSLPGCFPTILNATIQTRGPQRLRRRLQLTSSSTLTVVFSLVVSQVNQGDFHQPWHQLPFETALSQILISHGLTLQRLGTVRGDPLQTPQASMQPTHDPLVSIASETLPPSLQPTFEPTPVPSIAFTLGTSVDITQPPQILQPSMPPTLDQTENTQPPSTGPPTTFAITQPADAGFLLTPGSETLLPSPQPTFEPTPAPSIAFTLGTVVIPTPVQLQQPSMSPTLDQTENTQPPTAGPLNTFSTTQQAAAGFFRTTQPTPSSSSQGTAPPRSSPTPVPTAQPEPLPTFEPTIQTTLAPTAIPTPLPTFEPTPQPIPEPTLDPTLEPTPTPTPQPTPPPTFQPSLQPTPAPTPQPTLDPTTAPVLTLPPVANPTATLPPVITTAQPVTSAPTTGTPTAAPSTSAPTTGAPTTSAPSTGGPTVTPAIPSAIPSHTPTASPSILPSGSPSNISPSAFPSKVSSHTPSACPSILPSGLPSSSPSSFPSASPSILPSGLPSSSSPSSLPSEVPSPTPSTCPSTLPSGLSSSIPSSHPSELPSHTPSASPSVLPSGLPSSSSPSSSPSEVPSPTPSTSPSIPPSGLPSGSPSSHPSKLPSHTPSASPSILPSSSSPSSSPSEVHSQTPSMTPSILPSGLPSGSNSPSTSPSEVPSLTPSASPSILPSGLSSSSPSSFPSEVPSLTPSACPSTHPSGVPSSSPSSAPSNAPSHAPSVTPSRHPSEAPSGSPSSTPSGLPSSTPSSQPSDLPTSGPTQAPVITLPPVADPTATLPPVIATAQPSTSAPTTQNPTAAPSTGAPTTGAPTTGAPSTGGPTVTPAIPSAIPSHTPTASPSNLRTSSCPSNVPSHTPRASPSILPSGLPSSSSPSSFPSEVPSHTPIASPSILPSGFPSSSGPSSSPSEAPSPTPNASPPTPRPSPNPSSCPSSQPSLRPTDRTTPPPTPKPTPKPSPSPSSCPSSQPSHRPTDRPTPPPTPVPTRVPTRAPTPRPSSSPSDLPTSGPSSTPSASPLSMPSSAPSQSPTPCPSKNPSQKPSSNPSAPPSLAPSTFPSGEPSRLPSTSPSGFPSQLPSVMPSLSPTSVPSRSPTGIPSEIPSDVPTQLPSTNPSSGPSFLPSGLPSDVPSMMPSSSPSALPSIRPSLSPSVDPSARPSDVPSQSPSGLPSSSPTEDIVITRISLYSTSTSHSEFLRDLYCRPGVAPDCTVGSFDISLAIDGTSLSVRVETSNEPFRGGSISQKVLFIETNAAAENTLEASCNCNIDIGHTCGVDSTTGLLQNNFGRTSKYLADVAPYALRGHLDSDPFRFMPSCNLHFLTDFRYTLDVRLVDVDPHHPSPWPEDRITFEWDRVCFGSVTGCPEANTIPTIRIID